MASIKADRSMLKKMAIITAFVGDKVDKNTIIYSFKDLIKIEVVSDNYSQLGEDAIMEFTLRPKEYISACLWSGGIIRYHFSSNELEVILMECGVMSYHFSSDKLEVHN